MRVLLVGTPASRARLRLQLETSGVDVAAEFGTLREARLHESDADGIILGPGRVVDSESAQEALTPREVDVLELLAEGLPNKAIAARLGIGDQTVKFHVASILGKLGATNRTDAVRRAVGHGLLTL